MTTTTDTILAIDLGRFKSVACVYSRSRLKVNAKVTLRKMRRRAGNAPRVVSPARFWN